MRKQLFILVSIVVVFQSCIFEKKVDFDDYIGCWKPMESTNKSKLSLLPHIQIEKRNDFYILAAKPFPGYDLADIFFYVCQEKKDHLVVNPSNYFDEADNLAILVTKSSPIYLDEGGTYKYLFFLNTIYEPTDKALFSTVAADHITVLKQ